MNNYPEIFAGFNRLTVLIIGDVMLDSYIWGAVERISPEAPVPVVTVKKRDYRLGGAGNVAVNVSAIGATPLICSLVGDDDAAIKLRHCFSKLGISDAGLVVSSSRPTTEKTRIIAAHQQVVRVDDETDRDASAEEEKSILERIEHLIDQANVIIFQDYDKGTLNPRVISQTVKLAKARNIPTVVDPKRRNFLAYEEVTLFKPNLKELRDGLKIEVDATKPDQVDKAVGVLMSKLKAEGVMATLSENGVFINYKGDRVKLPAHHRKIADVSGAGDTVVAIAAACVALGLDAKTIAGLANLGGGLVCQHVGVVPIDKAELLSEAQQLLD